MMRGMRGILVVLAFGLIVLLPPTAVRAQDADDFDDMEDGAYRGSGWVPDDDGDDEDTGPRALRDDDEDETDPIAGRTRALHDQIDEVHAMERAETDEDYERAARRFEDASRRELEYQRRAIDPDAVDPRRHTRDLLADPDATGPDVGTGHDEALGAGEAAGVDAATAADANPDAAGIVVDSDPGAADVEVAPGDAATAGAPAKTD